MRSLFEQVFAELGSDAAGVRIGRITGVFDADFADIEFPSTEVRAKFFARCAERMK